MIRDSVLLQFVTPGQTIIASGLSQVLGDLKGTVDLYLLIGTGAVFGNTTTQALDVYVQDSVDEGVTWQDLAHVQFTGLTVVAYMLSVRGAQSGCQNVIASSDTQLPLGSVRQGPWGDYLRLKWVVSGSPVYGFSLFANGVAK